jgi:hypothetical protein
MSDDDGIEKATLAYMKYVFLQHPELRKEFLAWATAHFDDPLPEDRDLDTIKPLMEDFTIKRKS